jgi:hypothetical protein
MDQAFHDAGYDHRKPWKVREQEASSGSDIPAAASHKTV